MYKIRMLTVVVFCLITQGAFAADNADTGTSNDSLDNKSAEGPAYKAGVFQYTLGTILGEFFIPRETWGKLTPDYSVLEGDSSITTNNEISIATFHHTVTGSRYSEDGKLTTENEMNAVVEVEKTHISKWKFSDIGYHVFIGQSGNVYMARPFKYQGAHTKGYNGNNEKFKGTNAGIAFIGCFDEKGCEEEGYKITTVTDEMIDSAVKVIAYLAAKFGMPITEDTVMPRSVLDIKYSDDHKTRFPYSPGNLIKDRVNDIIDGAKLLLETYKGQEFD